MQLRCGPARCQRSLGPRRTLSVPEGCHLEGNKRLPHSFRRGIPLAGALAAGGPGRSRKNQDQGPVIRSCQPRGSAPVKIYDQTRGETGDSRALADEMGDQRERGLDPSSDPQREEVDRGNCGEGATHLPHDPSADQPRLLSALLGESRQGPQRRTSKNCPSTLRREPPSWKMQMRDFACSTEWSSPSWVSKKRKSEADRLRNELDVGGDKNGTPGWRAVAPGRETKERCTRH